MCAVMFILLLRSSWRGNACFDYAKMAWSTEKALYNMSVLKQ